jgi:hypothetical protein
MTTTTPADAAETVTHVIRHRFGGGIVHGAMPGHQGASGLALCGMRAQRRHVVAAGGPGDVTCTRCRAVVKRWAEPATPAQILRIADLADEVGRHTPKPAGLTVRQAQLMVRDLLNRRAELRRDGTLR